LRGFQHHNHLCQHQSATKYIAPCAYSTGARSLKPPIQLHPSPRRVGIAHQRRYRADGLGDIGLGAPLLRPAPVQAQAGTAQARTVLPRHPRVAVDCHTGAVHEGQRLPLPAPGRAPRATGSRCRWFTSILSNV